jgi:hypothetical protein
LLAVIAHSMDRAPTPTSTPTSSLHPLLHRWFVQYNPIYLVSAALVLAGMITTSRGLAHEGSLYGFLGVAAIAEVYAFALIGGAALLVRIGQKRPAVMLAILTVLYQSDLTLHTETCANLGPIGGVAGIAWLGLFAAKLSLLAWALQIRIDKRAIATALTGAASLVVMPHVLARADVATASGVLAVFVFAIGSLVPTASEQGVTSRATLDAWGKTVLSRAVRATWVLWGVLLGLHVLFWKMQHPMLHLGAVLPALGFVLLRLIRSEARVWIAVSAMLAAIFIIAPQGFSPCALLAALALLQRAFSRGHLTMTTIEAVASSDPSPYRAPETTPASATTVTVSSLVPIGAAERVRLFSGALFGMYLSTWTFGWHGGALPAHVLLLDVGLVIGALAMVWRRRARLVLVPTVTTCIHGLVAHEIVPMPESLVAQGAVAVTLGFVLLAGSLFTSYRLRDVSATPATRTHPR